MKILVGNLAVETGETDLLRAFEVFGVVDRVNVARTSLDGVSRGFAFVDIALDGEARAAIKKLNGSTMHGRKLRVGEARRRTSKS
jgi:RNA recognition motif-containing protein